MAGGSADATIRVGVEGADQAASAAGKITSAWQGAGKKIGEGFKGLGETIGGAAEEMISDLTRVANVAGAFSFAESIKKAQEFRESVTKMSIYAGTDVKKVGESFDYLSNKTGVPATKIMEFSKSLGRLTYDTQGSAQAFEGLNAQALLTGRSAEEMIPLGAAMHNVFGVTGDLTDSFASINGQAEKLGTVGGGAALQDSLKGVLGTVEGLNMSLPQTTALLGAFQGKSSDPQKGSRMFNTMIGQMKGDVVSFARFLGKDAREVGKMLQENPAQLVSDYQAYGKKKYGTGEAAYKRLVNQYGLETGTELYNARLNGTDFGKKAQEAGGAKSNAAEEADKAWKASGAGKHEASLAKAEQNARKTADPFLGAVDEVQGFSANHPLLSMLGVNAGGSLLKKGVGGLIKGGFGKLGGLFGGGGVGGVGGGVGAAALAGEGAATGAAGAGAGALALSGAAVVGAGAAGYAIGTFIDNLTGASDKISELFAGNTSEQGKKDTEELEARSKALHDAKKLAAPYTADAEGAQSLTAEQMTRQKGVAALEGKGLTHEAAMQAAGNLPLLEIQVITDGIPVTAHGSFKHRTSVKQ